MKTSSSRSRSSSSRKPSRRSTPPPKKPAPSARGRSTSKPASSSSTKTSSGTKASGGASEASKTRASGSPSGAEIARAGESNKGDRVELSGKEQSPRSDFVNPLNNMFEAGAGVESSRSRESETVDGRTTHRESESREGHARASVSGNLSEGRFGSEFDVGASAENHESSVTRAETEIGGVQLAAEGGGSADVTAEAGLRSSTEVDLANSTFHHDSRAAVDVNARVDAHAATEVGVGGATLRDEARVGAGTHLGAEVSRTLNIDENGIESRSSASAEAAVAADAAVSRELSYGGNSVQTEARGEARLGAEAHANSHFELSEDRFNAGGDFGFGANASLMGEGTFRSETQNGSTFSTTAGGTIGSVGMGAGGNIGREPGRTSFGIQASGSIVGGLHFNTQATIADRDIAETASAPLAAGGSTYSAIGDGADAVARVTDGMRQSANQRQDFLHEMGSQSTGNFIADTGIAAAESAHGVYRNGVEFADTFAEEAGHAYHAAGERLSSTADAVTDRVERAVGGTLDYAVERAHTGAQYGRAVGGGFIQGLGQGAYNITSLGGLLW